MVKRINFRGSFVLTMLLALVLPILAACGGNSGAGGGATSNTTPAAGATAAAPEMTAAPPSGGEATAMAPEATAAAPGGSGETANAKPGVLRFSIPQEPENLDPQKASFLGEIQWILLNWQPLMTFDEEMKPVPGQAESLDISADGKTYTFKLRANSKYSDGSPLTAKNYEYAWKRLANPEVAGEYQFIACDIIKGYSAYAAATCQGKSLTETLALDLPTLRDQMGVKALDDQTLQIELEKPAPYFSSIAALWVSAPIREEDTEDDTNLATAVPEHYVGNGPMILKEHEPDVKAVWEANPNYALGPLKLQGIEMTVIKESQVAFQAYKNGELDMLPVLAAEDLTAVDADATLSKEAIDVPGQCTFYLGFNNAKPPFDNQKVRQAFAQAVDREAWVRDVLKGLGKPTQTFIPPGFPGYEASDQWAFNAEKAKATLADAGFPNGQGLPEIKLTFSSSARNKVRYEFLANQFKQNLGINATLDPVDATAFTGLTKDPATTPQLFVLGWCADFPDPQNWLTAVFKTGGSASARLTFSNEQFDKLVTEADNEVADQAKRAKLYSDAQKLLIQEAPVAFIYNDANKALVKPYVKGIKTLPLDYFPGFYNLNNIEVTP